MDPKTLLAKQELNTYLDGLYDALNMSKPEIRKAIKIIVETEYSDDFTE